ncbi:MAG TPA: hypothetical protein VK808_03115 [Bacteroidia bacterium]|jgi:hypothetical protein|nr:hypothetical protein [Bacteroidia bacterium]
MKRTLIILTLLAAGGLGVYYSIPKQSTTEISVMRDITSQQLAQPEITSIMPLYKLDSNEWNGAIFRFSNITNLSLNQMVEVTIPSENKWLSNEFDRAKAIKAFTGQITNILTVAQSDTVGRWNSSIYLPLSTELNLLSQSSAQTKVLLAYTDLMEYEPNLSFYSKKVLALLVNNPDKVKQYLEKQQPLNNLKGIEVYLIYQPENTTDDSQYRVVSNFYKQMLESAGAKVTITPNLID